MNREEILKTLRALPFDKKDYWLVTGGAMVWYGFREETHDVDLGCSRALADRLEKEGVPFSRTKDGKRRFRYSEDVELFEEWMQGEAMESDGVPVVSVTGLLAMKRKLGREKDKRDIALILKYLEEHACIL